MLIRSGVGSCVLRWGSPLSDSENRLPEALRAWIEQLLEPEVTRLFDVFPDAQIDVRLSASRGKVRRHPTITVNGGPMEMIDP